MSKYKSLYSYWFVGGHSLILIFDILARKSVGLKYEQVPQFFHANIYTIYSSRFVFKRTKYCSLNMGKAACNSHFIISYVYYQYIPALIQRNLSEEILHHGYVHCFLQISLSSGVEVHSVYVRFLYTNGKMQHFPLFV